MEVITIDFFEFCFLVEACVPPRPIARTMFWHKAINTHYHALSPDERAHLHDWMQKDYSYQKGLKEGNEDVLWFEARYNPDNQYIVEADGKERECFLRDGKYCLGIYYWISPKHITNVKKANSQNDNPQDAAL
jgi:hypothetical protein